MPSGLILVKGVYPRSALRLGTITTSRKGFPCTLC